MIKNITVFNDTKDKFKAFDEIKEKIDTEGVPKLIIFFSYADGFDFFSLMFSKEYPETTVIGASSAMSYSTYGYGESVVTASVIYDGIECASGTLLEIAHYPKRYTSEIDRTISEISNLKNTVCLEFCTASGKCEELVQDTFRGILEGRKIPVVGGTAGASTLTSPTWVSLNGTVYNEACVFVLIKNLGGKIKTYKENIYRPTTKYITATDVDCDERIVYEFDGRPAMDVMAEIANLPAKELKNKFIYYPLGRVRGDDIYITSPDRAMPDGSVTFFARIYNRTKLALLESDNIEAVWEKTAEEIKKEIPNPSFAIGINCYYRTYQFKLENRNGDFAAKLTKEYGNYISMSSFGEQYNYEHFNQTLVMCVFE